MKSNRLEAFSDGVLAIIITIMVLELKAPEEPSWHELKSTLPVFLSYVFSFVYVGIYWNNHHHLFQATEKVNGKILLANLHLLFWLSLIPFTTSWLGENYTAALPVALYGFDLLMCAIAYFILQGIIINFHDSDSVLKDAIGKDIKGKISLVIYVMGLLLSFYNTWISILCYMLVALIWLMPDKRVEKNMI
jgi:uncharacterized membrane protein